jgi:hypothetical protein
MMLLMAIGWLVVIGAVAAGMWWLLKHRRRAGDPALAFLVVPGLARQLTHEPSVMRHI